ncbi:plasmid mobilization relaxosome protein MobC [Mucilaginibacter sp.]|uniref:plasmid mobilization protein n=1 Tax=Mucilaginibacter sp. TaxID=1882438 RepID=UPI0025D29164|nr:plasmid mobilization relaxosome protein MobC [Mucilaginibacter sp.]
MARPRISKEVARSVNFTIRLTGEEQRAIENAAAACGITPSALVRQKVLKGKFPKPRLARVDLDTYLELKKIGVNLNQMIRLANAGIMHQRLENQLVRLWQQQQEVITLLISYDSHTEDR